MKHIALMLTNLNFEAGGAGIMTVGLANEFAQRGYKVSLVSLHYFAKTFIEVDKSIEIYHLQQSEQDKSVHFTGNIVSRLKTHHTIFRRLRNIIKRNKIDALICSGIEITPTWIPIKFWNKKIKVISWEHMNATLEWPSFVKGRKLARKYADAIVVLTQQDKELYLEEGPCNAKIFVRNNFISNYPTEAATLKAKNVLAVGRYAKQKGFDILVNIWSKVKQNTISNDWLLRIVGEGDERKDLEKLINEKNLEDSLVLTGSTSNVSQYYLDSSIYVMTSRHEGFGLVLIEAQSYGLPTISFDCIAGPREIINNGEDGFVIPIGDNDEMAERILELMSNEQLRKAMGKKAKENSERFKKNRIVDQWVKLINEL